MQRDHQSEQAGATGGSTLGGVAPGKRTRTDGLRASNVTIAREADASGAVAEGAEAAVDRASGSSGAPLDASVRGQFEGSLGVDLSGVRVHTGAASAEAAEAVGARAYTVGNDIHFAEGEYDPEDPYGQHLLAHEVAHTVQQDGAPQRQHKMAVSEPGDAAEVEADQAADAMVAGTFFDVSGSTKGVSRAPDAKPRPLTAAEKAAYLETMAYAEVIMKQAETVQDALLKFHLEEVAEIEKISSAAGKLVVLYDAAHTRHAEVIKKANEVSETPQKVFDFVLNVVVGAATAGIGGVFFPAKQVAFSMGRALFEELISQTASTYLSSVIEVTKSISVTEVAKQNKEAERWEMIADLYREAADLVPALGKVSKFAQGATKVVADCRFAAGGLTLSFFKDRAALDSAIKALKGAGAEGTFKAVQSNIDVGWKQLRHKRIAIEDAARGANVREMEKKIWLEWVASRPQQGTGDDRGYEQLDNDTVEEHLEALGVTGETGELGYASGKETDSEDERIWQASASAKTRVLQGVGMIGRLSRDSSDGRKYLASPDKLYVPCDVSAGPSDSGWYKVVGVQQEEGKTQSGEKRIDWLGRLMPLSDYEVDKAGIDKTWRHDSEK